LKIKAIFVSVISTIVVFTHGWEIAVAVAYGGSVALLGSLLVRYHMWRSEKTAGNDAEKSLRIVFRCAVERFVLTIALLAIGFAVLELHALALLSGFIATQMLAFLDTLKNRV
jgi:F0F1-type ATP synthase assembly protein I